MTVNVCANKLDHIAIMVSDLEQSCQFYRDLLGLKKIELYEEQNIVGASAAHGLAEVHLKLCIMAAPDTRK